MISRKKIKDLLLSEVQKYGRREAARRIKIDKESLINYIDEATEPRSANLQKIADHFHKPIAYFIEDDRIVPSNIHEQLDSYNKPEKHQCVFCGNMSDDIRTLCKSMKDIMESGHPFFVPALKSNIEAFKHSVDKERRQDEDIRKLKDKVRHLEKLLDQDPNTGTGRAAGTGVQKKKM